ncbi:hypothetical protein XENOCAPTIV_021535, partial [Xenoophorus captivus]
GSPKEVVSVSNMGMSKRGPIIEGRDQLLLEFTDGSVCMSEGQKLSYSTQIHLVCSRGASSCVVVDPVSGFKYNLQLLASKEGYKTTANGKDFMVKHRLLCQSDASRLQLNICEDAPGCGPGMGGCELENSHPVSPVGVEKTLKYSTDGVLQLTYKGVLDGPTATRDTFTINFVCDPNSHPGSLKLVQEDLSTLSSHAVHDVLFEFSTALACIPAPVDCRIAACGVISGKGFNLGYMQSSPQVADDGSISIVYRNGDKCGDSSTYSTRIVLQCDDNPDGCEYVFIWRTSEACPIRKVKGENCRVRDPKSGYEFDFTSLKNRDFAITSNKYSYHLSVCSELKKNMLTFVGDQIILNYTNGETCHKIYQRSTVISFSCHPDKHP